MADGEHLPVEVLALQLDRRRLARDHRGAGALLVFIPCVGEYVIPELLGTYEL